MNEQAEALRKRLSAKLYGRMALRPKGRDITLDDALLFGYDQALADVKAKIVNALLGGLND